MTKRKTATDQPSVAVTSNTHQENFTLFNPKSKVGILVVK